MGCMLVMGRRGRLLSGVSGGGWGLRKRVGYHLRGLFEMMRGRRRRMGCPLGGLVLLILVW